MLIIHAFDKQRLQRMQAGLDPIDDASGHEPERRGVRYTCAHRYPPTGTRHASGLQMRGRCTPS